MPDVGDHISTTIITELDGVSMSTHLLWQIDNLGAEDTVFNNISAIGLHFASSAGPYSSAEWKVTCVTYNNLSQNEAKVVAPLTGFGDLIDDSLPQNLVLQFRRYALRMADQKVRSGHIFQSGVSELRNTRGRFNKMAELIAMENFLGTTTILPAGAWTIHPLLEITPDWVNFPLVKERIRTVSAQANPVFSVLTGRRTKLCGTG